VLDYVEYDKISHVNLLEGKPRKPFLKLKSTKETDRFRPVPRLETAKIINVLRSLDTNNLIEEFRNRNLNNGAKDASESDAGDTTSGSESNFDDKELLKVLPVMHKHKRKSRKPRSKYFSIRSQRQNSKGDGSSKKLNNIQKPILRSESFTRKVTKNKNNISSTSQANNLCKSSNNIKNINLPSHENKVPQ
jgi:hypothetical protein